ncbi:cell wall integrity and stress response component 4-like [Dendroctonus ponderosae]|uniref:cell wall integrity and stress response component 4 n=1 Tax=Dendroctonus ponderosae TaxID=77166 RepID=UPI00203506AD|nr:cell wall integrity and stress response component 4 [Dendroctonus ponderosae]XP_048519233.1 cell wall integrity and stress response component 4-like [Dendroctonus ponderosae]KAH1010338.1 hypothetical protein HUJ05_004643 [Dendroctonus ponderosae]
MFHFLALGVFFAAFVALDAQQCYRCFGRHWCNDVAHPDFESNVTIMNCPATAAKFSYEGDSPTIAKFIHSLERLSTSSGGEEGLSETTWGCVTATIHEAHEVHTIRTCLNNAETICPVVQTVVLNPDLNDVPDEVELDCGGCIGMLCNDHSFAAPDAPSTSSTASPETTSSSTATPDSTTSSTTTPTPETSTSTTTTGGPDGTTSSPTVPSSSSTTPTTPESTTTSATTPSPETSTSTTTTGGSDGTTSSPTVSSSSSTTPTTPEATSNPEATSSTSTTASPDSSTTTTTESTTTEVSTSTTTTTPGTSSTTSEVPDTTENAPETTTTGSVQAPKGSYGLLMLTLCIEWIRYVRA